MERIPDYEILPQFVERWSPRAMTGDPVSEAELLRLFEAARWAPSCANSQPWRFVYARAGTPHFNRVFELLSEGNRPWCARAGALIVVLSKKTFDDGRTSPTHSYDTGAAWMSLALQGSAMGLVVHGMAGFDYNRARAGSGRAGGLQGRGHDRRRASRQCSIIFRKGIGLAKSRARAGR